MVGSTSATCGTYVDSADGDSVCSGLWYRQSNITEFWGHTFYDWEEIVAPNSLSEGLWDERSAFAGLSIDLRYEDQIHSYYEYFYDKNIPVDMIPVDADFSRYQIIVAPVLYMVKEDMKESLENLSGRAASL